MKLSISVKSPSTILLLAVCGYALRYIVVMLYCFLCHLLVYRWSTCSNDDLSPKSFVHSFAIISSASPCNGDELVLVYIPTTYSQFERRQTIRDTWAKNLSNGKWKTKLVFVLGAPKVVQGSTTARLRSELQEFDDTVHYDIIDHYYNLTLKTRAIFNWTLHHCPRVQFLIRADSDIVLHGNNLYRFLDHHRSMVDRTVVYGRCRPYDCVTRIPWSKSCLPRSYYEYEHRALFYPSYCLGFSSVISIEYVRRAVELWKGQSRSAYLPMEDLHAIGYTGKGVRAWKVNHPMLFKYDKYFDSYSCQSSAIASAAYTDETIMRDRWRRFQNRCA